MQRPSAIPHLEYGGMTKKQPSSGSYNYVHVMKELEKQSSKKRIDI
jgi:hypothetical protein